MSARRLLASMVCLLFLAAPARAKRLDTARLLLRDVPGSGGSWQEGSAVVAAPVDEVRHWLTDYPAWPKRFDDIEWSQALADDAAGRHVVRFRSRIAGRTLTVHEAVTKHLISFEGDGPEVHTQGRIWLLDAGGGATRVIMQSTSEVHGLLGLFATRGLKRRRAFEVIQADLDSLLALAGRR
ncbi:MAG TPA: SRPBCC family protein [Polyangia bacterium]|jgi:hypothetical protein